MCGLAGIIFEQQPRHAEEREQLAWLFTRLLVLSQARGRQATGAAWLKRDGNHRLFKRPMTAERFITQKAFHELLAGVDNRTTLLMGHTRHPTRGDKQVNRNNHPIRAGDVIGTHNGTIYNADNLFCYYRLRRFAEVDSEILLRLAAHAIRNGRVAVRRFKQGIKRCHGQIAAVMSSRSDPRTTLLLKGNNPLELRWNRRIGAILYASDRRYLNAVLSGERGWCELSVPPMNLLVFRHENLTTYSAEPFTFVTQKQRRLPL